MMTEQHDQQAARQSRWGFFDLNAMRYFRLEMSHFRRPVEAGPLSRGGALEIWAHSDDGAVMRLCDFSDRFWRHPASRYYPPMCDISTLRSRVVSSVRSSE
jgi:hypothetical protein